MKHIFGDDHKIHFVITLFVKPLTRFFPSTFVLVGRAMNSLCLKCWSRLFARDLKPIQFTVLKPQ